MIETLKEIIATFERDGERWTEELSWPWAVCGGEIYDLRAGGKVAKECMKELIKLEAEVESPIAEL